MPELHGPLLPAEQRVHQTDAQLRNIRSLNRFLHELPRKHPLIKRGLSIIPNRQRHSMHRLRRLWEMHKMQLWLFRQGGGLHTGKHSLRGFRL